MDGQESQKTVDGKSEIVNEGEQGSQSGEDVSSEQEPQVTTPVQNEEPVVAPAPAESPIAPEPTPVVAPELPSAQSDPPIIAEPELPVSQEPAVEPPAHVSEPIPPVEPAPSSNPVSESPAQVTDPIPPLPTKTDDSPQARNNKEEKINKDVDSQAIKDESPIDKVPAVQRPDLPLTPLDSGSALPLEQLSVAPRDPMEIAKSLDRDVLEAAFKLLAIERSKGLLQAKKISDRKKVKDNSDRMMQLIAGYKNGVRRTTIADKLNMPPSRVTDYLQRLIVSGKVRAEGKTHNRRFYVS